ncbi:twitching motility protein [Bacteriovorax sp. BSW11_IV]|uniref:type IV pilus twitching motility protein PilT n=1 Tax=Bacteriovorax sp. BSW11_IV TaxID=1353529 RepID=UPI00038A413C|nr:PilT/PilU family type 4a pilus ATPase [Bacteriovorax sp. BSW11_IV]EQC49224.1 twitching motility protein [Bacteriovorax sp. BSW11_IV]
MPFKKEHLASLIQVAIDNKASDIHIREGEAPALRIKGELYPVKSNRQFTYKDIEDISRIVGALKKIDDNLTSINEVDGAYEIENVSRLRYNVFRFADRYGIIFRIINMNIPTIAELNLSSTLYQICENKRGLILVTGATGSGKTTTLAAMINHINENKQAHIVTIEDPIEFLHPQKKCRISQREIGKDTPDFMSALRSALRQDPDIILIGELRDAETISTALKASETGHLVIGTVHTKNVISTVGRLISMFPQEEQEEARKRISESLQAVICQRILKSNSKQGVVVAQEICITSPGVRECILGEEPLARLNNIMAKSHGCQTFDGHIMKLYQDGLISKEVALETVSSQSDFLQKLIVE